MVITNLKYANEDHTTISAVIDGVPVDIPAQNDIQTGALLLRPAGAVLLRRCPPW